MPASCSGAHTHRNTHRGTTGRTAGATTPKMAAVVTPNDADNIISILLTSHMAEFPSPDAAIRPHGRHLSALRPLYDTSSPVTQTQSWRSRMTNNPRLSRITSLRPAGCRFNSQSHRRTQTSSNNNATPYDYLCVYKHGSVFSQEILMLLPQL